MERLEAQAQHTQQTENVASLAREIAHDLNVVLMAILSNAELLSLRTETEDPRRSYIDEIREAVTRGSGIARQLSGIQPPLQRKPVDVNHLIAQSTPSLRRLVGSEISVVTRLSPAPIVITGDPSQMEQLLVNLAITARDDMPEGGRLTIETSRAADPVVQDEPLAGEYLRLSVTSRGRRVGPASAPVESTRHAGAAHGHALGLAAVQAIVARHGGVVQVERTKSGVTTRVWLPCAQWQDSEDVA